MQQVSPLDIFLISSQVIEFYWIMLAKSSSMGHSKQSTGDVEVDLGRYELRRSGRKIRIERKPMELLIFLLERREQMVSREEIVKRLWRSDRFIDTEKNVNNIVRKLRTALVDNADRPRFLETVFGKGYRFVGPVRVIDAKYPLSDPGLNAVRTDARKDGSDLAERSSIAVLPLLLLEKATDDQGLCLGFADALVSLLGNLSGVDVLPTSAVLNLPLDLMPSEIASRLGVRFVIHGAIQKSKGSGASRWRCSTLICSAPASRRNATSTWIALRVSKAILRSKSPAH